MPVQALPDADERVPPNPATFNDRIIARLASELREFLGETGKILDPFAGPGGIHALRPLGWETYGVEIERDWARGSSYTFLGDATQLTGMRSIMRRRPFDAVVTSPTYGNRMADHHEARDPCRECNGEGGPVDDVRRCPTCNGSGLTRRHTYRHEIGHALNERNTGGMQWGDQYRDMHRLAWTQCWEVLREDGLLILNVKDHVRDGNLQGVPGWHVRTLQSLGFLIENVTALATGGMRHGANHTLRADAELVITFRKGDPV